MALPMVQLPSFAVPMYLNKPPTGELTYDLVPLVTMLSCVPTLWLFWVKGRYADLATYTGGFVAAVVYHWLALSAHGGLASVSFLGLHGAGWRTIDILGANVLLARTMGHALNVDHPLIALVPNVALPIMLVLMLAFLPGASLGLASRLTAVVMGLTVVLQLGQEGLELRWRMRRTYGHPRALRALVALAVGIFSFAMPSLRHEQYWLWHSLWHVFMGVGYWDLYVHLIDGPTASSGDSASGGKQQQQQHGCTQGVLDGLRGYLLQLAQGKGAAKASQGKGTATGGNAGQERRRSGGKQQEGISISRGRSSSHERRAAGGGGRGRNRSRSRGAGQGHSQAAAGALNPRGSSTPLGSAAVKG